MDTAAVYVALSRATCIDDIYLRFPIALYDPARSRNNDIVALIEYFKRLEQSTLAALNLDPSKFAPATASLHQGEVMGANPPQPSPNPKRKRTGRHGTGATRRLARLMPNKDNNCFLNSSIALALAAYDAQPLPDSSQCTPAAGAFFSCLQLVRDAMFGGSSLLERILVRITSYLSCVPTASLVSPISTHAPNPPFNRH